MGAVCWYGKNDVRVENVPDSKILNPRDAIVLYDGCIPTMQGGDILGHEFMGEVGNGVKNLKAGALSGQGHNSATGKERGCKRICGVNNELKT